MTPGFEKSAQLRTATAHTELAWRFCLGPRGEGRDLPELRPLPHPVLGDCALLPGPQAWAGS